MNIHEYLKERGFEMTGEFRNATTGEYYLNAGGFCIRHELISIQQTAGMYVILKKLCQTFEFDGQTFEVPEGYVFERVGLAGSKDVGKYVLNGPDSPYPPQQITLESLGWRDCVYIIFRKEN